MRRKYFFGTQMGTTGLAFRYYLISILSRKSIEDETPTVYHAVYSLNFVQHIYLFVV